MNLLKLHGRVFLLLAATVLVAYGRLLSTPLWNPLDFQIVLEARTLSADPLAMFRHIGAFFSQPILQIVFMLEYKLFGWSPAGYQAVNLLVHAANAFLVYMLVNMLFPRNRIALLASLLFALGVGSYGKVLMSIEQLETLLLSFFHILVLYLFIRNDFRHEGRLSSPYFLAGLVLFMAAGLTRVAYVSLLGCLLAYKFFFYKRRVGRPVVDPGLVIFVVVGSLFYLAQDAWGFRTPSLLTVESEPLTYALISIKNVFRYLVLMFFPLQSSPMLAESSLWVQLIYEARTVIRFLLTLAIVSYSFFGFVFGNSAVRFFIAFTFITVLPFSGVPDSGRWLNLNHLYLTSLGFCVILAAGTRGTSNLLQAAGWRRFLPYMVPLYFVVLSLTLTYKLDARHREQAQRPQIEELRENLVVEAEPGAPRPEIALSASRTRHPAAPRP